MQVNLSKEDLANLVRGTTPSYEAMEHPLVKKSGTYTGGFADHWDWNYSFADKLTEEELLQLYNICKKIK